MSPSRATASAAFLFTLGLGACGPSFREPEDPPEAASARFEPYVFEARSGDTVHAELGRFDVPLRRSRSLGGGRGGPEGADGRVGDDGSRAGADSLELAFVRFPSTAEDPGPPIAYLAGGPGGSGIGAARGSRFPLFQALRRFGDVIAFDQRGTGMSEGPARDDCEATRSYPAGEPLDEARLHRLALLAARACGEEWREAGVDPAAWNTVESADDLAALADALGAARLRLWGISYGTHLALATIRRHPDRVRDAILAGVEGPDHTVKLPSLWQAQLEKLEALVAADPGLSREFPDVTALVDSVLGGLRRRPARVQFVDAAGGDTTETLVSAYRVQLVTIDRLRDPPTLTTVPFLYRRMARGDFTAVADPSTTVGGFSTMSDLTDAASGISETRLFRFYEEDANTLLGGGDQLADAEAARAFDIPDLGPAFRAPVRSDIPVLFISGTLDGRTPVSNAEGVLPGFPNGRHLVVENAGHSDDLFLSSPRILEVMTAFLAGDPLPTLRIRVPPPDFEAARPARGLSAERVEEITGAYVRAPGDVWRVVLLRTVRSLDAGGRETGRDAALLVRFRGNGFPFRPAADGTFRIAFPGAERYRFWLERDAAGRKAALAFHTGGADTVRMAATSWEAVGFVEADHWRLAGPFRTEEAVTCEPAFPPEEDHLAGGIDVDDVYATGQGEVRWRRAAGDDGFVNFEETFGGATVGGVGYAHLTVVADAPLDARLRLGTDDDARVFLDGERVHAFDGARTAWEAQDSVPVRLRAGDNELLVKVCNRDADWKFNLRITDSEGRSLVTEKTPGRVRVRSIPEDGE